MRKKEKIQKKKKIRIKKKRTYRKTDKDRQQTVAWVGGRLTDRQTSAAQFYAFFRCARRKKTPIEMRSNEMRSIEMRSIEMRSIEKRLH